ncbi:MAG TPA: membrane protein insertion efficiency factor YidD [Nitrospirota bacterium]|nr:membrane protein insertion efficiency factor YidD [Nitrospirota bacterium]
MNRFFISIIHLYQRYVSPFLPSACRFTPSCSEYAVEAFEQKPALRALGMTAMRIAKCHPLHPGGYDPVK